MAINYFSQLGFDQFGQRQQQAALGAQNMRSNEQGMQINQLKMERQQAADQQAMLQFANEQQKQRAAQGAGAFYNALNSGNDSAALQIAQQYADDINGLGDPSFTADSVAQLMQTPEGKEQLKQMSLGMVQMAGGPEQMARFTAQQARPERAADATAQIKNTAEYRRYTDDIRKAVASGDIETAKALQQERDFFVNQVDPFARGIATGQARITTEQQLTPELAERARQVESAKQDTVGGKLEINRQEFEQKLKEAEKEEAAKARQQKREVEVADARNALLDIDNLSSTVNRILEVPGSVQSSATGPILSRLPTVRRSVADYEELINSFESQAFTAQVAKLKGMGALSDAEGRKLAAALGNISLRQSPEQIQLNLQRVLEIMDQAKSNLIKKSGIPEQELIQQDSGRSQQGVIEWSSL